MNDIERELVTSTLEDSVIEFFRAYRIACTKTGSPAGPHVAEMGSIVGFRGKGVRGGLAFVAPLSLLEPAPARAEATRRATDLQLRDWSAEIANQLVGRIKNKLTSSQDAGLR